MSAPNFSPASNHALPAPSLTSTPSSTSPSLTADTDPVDPDFSLTQSEIEEYCRRFYDEAVSYARRLRKSSASLQDRIDAGDTESAAGLGLLRAASSYQPAQGPFGPWMRRHVRYEVWEAARQATLVPRSVMGRLKELRQAEIHLEAEFGRPATPAELAGHLNVDLTELSSLYELRNSAREPSEIDPTVAEAAVADEESTMVSEAMAAFGPLSGDERVVLALHYMEGIPFREVARILDKRPDAVSRIHGKAKATMSDFLSKLIAEA